MKGLLLAKIGYRLVAGSQGRAWGETALSSVLAFSPAEHCGFFFSDVLLLGVLIPVCLLGVLWVLPARFLLVVTFCGSWLMIGFFTIQMIGYRNVGKFQTRQQWLDAIRWGAAHTDDIETYLGWKSVAGLSGLVLLSAAPQLMRWIGRVPARMERGLWSGIVALLVGILAIGALHRVPSSNFHRSLPRLALGEFLELDGWSTARYRDADSSRLIAEWQRVANLPGVQEPPSWFGANRGCDLLIVVFETLPAEHADWGGTLEHLPNLKRLAHSSWRLSNHHTTYPYTREALFSLLSGWYPTDLRHFATGGAGQPIPGVLQSARAAGYQTAAFLPEPKSDFESQLLEAQGVSELFVSQPGIGPARSHGGPLGDHPLVAERRRADLVALEELTRRLRDWIASDQRFAAMFLPQLGHGPWPALASTGLDPDADWQARCRALLVQQDVWLGEILDLLNSLNRLDRTVILVTADHGVRTREEHPRFRGGELQPLSFHIPALLHAPGAAHGEVLDAPTSHIDFSPTLSALLGWSRNNDPVIGLPVTDPQLRDRRLFLFGGRYLGADGFIEAGECWQWQHSVDIATLSDSLQFTDRVGIPRDASATVRVRDLLRDASALQYQTNRVWVPGGAGRSE
ncbi:MAG: LTA synthase family protein [Planctomycetaceae bacterium]